MPARKLKTVSLSRITEAEEIKRLKSENAGLLERNADLTEQLKDARVSRTITPAELESIARLRVEHREMSEQQNKLALFLRENFRAEIERGEHAGLSLSDVICKYLAKVKHGGKK